MIKLLLFICLFLSQNILAKDSLIIGSKKFSESFVLSEMVAVLLEEKYNTKVIRKLGLGGTQVAFDALKTGGIHVYPEYTGTGYIMILKKEGQRNPEKVYQIVKDEFDKKWSIVWSKPLGFNNTYALAVRRSDPRFKEIENISQLQDKTNDLRYAGAYEFMERKDGHKRFVQHYDLVFHPKNVITMDAGLMYSAIKNKKVDVIVAYSTDGRISAYNLKTLNDDYYFFPPYYVSLIAKKETLQKYPQLQKVFHQLEGQISQKEMMYMNDLVDRKKIPAQKVARNFLIKKGILQGKVEKLNQNESFFSYALSKKDYLIKIIKEHLILSFGALFIALIISLPIGVILSRYRSLGHYVFPVINTIQTIPSLALLGFLIPLMGIGIKPALVALFLYSLLPLIRNTYSGLIAVDKNYIEASKGIGLTKGQILFKVELPLALPIIMTGVRTATVIVIGTATLAALIGAGGLGDPIFRGVATVNSQLILLGAFPSALLAIITDKLIGLLESKMVSPGLVLQNKK